MHNLDSSIQEVLFCHSRALFYYMVNAKREESPAKTRLWQNAGYSRSRQEILNSITFSSSYGFGA